MIKRGRRKTWTPFHHLERLEPRRLLSLTHLYTFNDGTANDGVGTVNGTLYNGAAVSNGRLQLQNAGITSGGTVQYARLMGTLLPASGSATIYAWYYTDSSTPNAMRVFDFGNGPTGSYVSYTPKSSSNNARAYFDTTTAAEVNAGSPIGTTAAQGYRNFVAVVVDATANMMSLYLNGALSGTAALGGANIGAINEASAYLGRSQFTADAGFSGSIDELRIYDEARTAEQIAADDVTGPAFAAATSTPARQVERLDRGMVALPATAAGGIYVSWRLLGTDPAGTGFNLYRSANNGAFVKLNGSPIMATTDYQDTGANKTYVNKYYIRPVIGGVEQAPSETYVFTAGFASSYLSIPLQIPAGGHLPGTADTTEHDYTYSACDTSVGDVDGDGQYEFIVRWDPSDSKDNSQDGYTGNVYIDCYKMNGTMLWRIDLGVNIRAGAHYTQFQVYDLDGDGKAEVAMKTAPGTIDGQGHYVLLGTDSPTADYRTDQGYILSGPEYLTVFNGLTGAAMATAAYTPDRGTLSNWGDTYGNRVDRFLAAVAYLDGARPSLIEARGYYTGSSGARNEITAWNYRNGQLTRIWWFKADLSNNNNMNSNYAGQGAHAIEIADLDLDGKDEIVYGACAIDDDGRPMWSTGLGHGDAIHVSDMDPTRPGIEIFQAHEGGSQAMGADFRSGITGEVYFGIDSGAASVDVGRAMAADIDPRYLGYEVWDSANGSLFSAQGVAIGPKPSSQNFGIWWDGDLGRELLDGTKIDKWNYAAGTTTRLVTGSGVSSCNGTKATPCLSGDILGDWREEVVWRTTDSSALRIYSTTTPATNRIFTLMHDIEYREAIAWQNSAYNQPPNPSFFLGYGMTTPVANVYYAGTVVATATLAWQAETAVLAGGMYVESNWTGFNGTGFVNFPTTGGSVRWNNVDGGAGGLTTIRFRYALGNTARTGRLTVNGLAQDATFATTTTWDNWSYLTVSVPLTAGRTNTILLESTGQDLGNVDELQVDAIVPAAPALQSVMINDGTAQRSMVKSITVTFDRAVNMGAGALALTRGGSAVTLVQTNPSGDGRVWVLTFTGAGIVGGSLADGLYDLQINPAGVRDNFGQALTGGVTHIGLHRLYGDFDGDRDVDALDLAKMSLVLNTASKFNAMFDYNGDGRVDGLDLLEFKKRLNKVFVP